MKTALSRAQKLIKSKGEKKIFKVPRTLCLPMATRGALHLIPIFAGLSALGALANGISGITKAVHDARSAKSKLNEATRHNKMMESIAMGKGLYLRPYKTGSGMKLRLHNDVRKKLRFHELAEPAVN